MKTKLTVNGRTHEVDADADTPLPTAFRIGGTFDVTLMPATLGPGPGTLRLVGTFDFGIPP